jgi:uncharacterized protein involved in type VI secretion and phage assembly
MNIFSNNQDGNKIYGILLGIVTSIDDPENKNRVKVRLLTQAKDNYETDFIRVASPFSGNEYGVFFMPEVDDEVIVGFNNGDIESPVVIGSLYNMKRKAPFTIENGENTTKALVSKENNKIVIDDSDDNKSIVIQTKSEYKVVIDDKNGKITISDKGENNGVLIDSNNGTIEVLAENEIKLKAGGATVTIGNGNVEIDSDSSIKITSSQIDIKGNSGVSIKSSSVLDVKSDGVTNVKGATVKIN